MAFAVQLSQNLPPVINNELLPFDTVAVNLGGGFDLQSSHFVAPVAGIYQINVTLRGNGYTAFHVLVNGSVFVVLFTSDTDMVTASTLISLTVGDNVWVETRGSSVYGSGDSHCSTKTCHFSGILIHQAL